MIKVKADKMITVVMVLLFSAVVLAESGKVISIEVNMGSGGSVELVSLRMYESEIPVASETGEYSLEVLSGQGSVIYTTRFDVSFAASPDAMPGHEGELTGLESVSLQSARVLLSIPYLDDAASFRIAKAGNILFTSDLVMCNNNGVCQAERGENFLSCAADCPSGGSDEFCDEIFDARCDPDCQAQGRPEKDTDCTCGNGACDGREDSYTCEADCGKQGNPFMKYMIGGIVLLLLVLVGLPVLIVVLVKKSKKKK